eukprot:8292085-Pyramimonas_sp.AAC.2
MRRVLPWPMGWGGAPNGAAAEATVALYGQMQPRAETDADTPMNTGEMTREQCEDVDWEFCMGAYWVRPRWIGWCRRCSALDDWKS